ncbi:hypothetical protein ACFWY9_43545 [Amycolatopsis sp. NPDC059027]|uniref:hypothetical protein n=1 Tax=unclassified Amycolatopsis TaxID=2618356 RepID=UPI00366A9F58
MKPLAEVSGVVAAPAPEVFARLERRLRGGGYPMRFEVDPERRTLAAQGGWWYRGEYAVEDHPAGTLVRHRVLNIAERGAWAVPLANRFFVGFRRRVRDGFLELLGELGGKNGVAGSGSERVR